MDYQRQLVAILTEAGEKGLSLSKIARHVYNSSCTLFESPSFDKVYADLALFLSRQSRLADGMVKRTGTRGVYAINDRWALFRQVVIDFDEHTTDETSQQQDSFVEDKSLTLPLFDF